MNKLYYNYGSVGVTVFSHEKERGQCGNTGTKTTRKENLTMRISKLRRVGSGLLAAVIAMSMYVGAALPAAAAAVGDDGSAEMNEAYAAH